MYTKVFYCGYDTYSDSYYVTMSEIYRYKVPKYKVTDEEILDVIEWRRKKYGVLQSLFAIRVDNISKGEDMNGTLIEYINKGYKEEFVGKMFNLIQYV